MVHVYTFRYRENREMCYIRVTLNALTAEEIQTVEREEEVTHFTDAFSLRGALSKLQRRHEGRTFYNSTDHNFVSTTRWTDHTYVRACVHNYLCRADGGNSTSDVLCETGRIGSVFTLELAKWRLFIACEDAHKLPFEDTDAKGVDESEDDEKTPDLPNLTVRARLCTFCT